MAGAILASSFLVAADSLWATAFKEALSAWAIHSSVVVASAISLDVDTVSVDCQRREAAVIEDLVRLDMRVVNTGTCFWVQNKRNSCALTCTNCLDVVCLAILATRDNMMPCKGCILKRRYVGCRMDRSTMKDVRIRRRNRNRIIKE